MSNHELLKLDFVGASSSLDDNTSAFLKTIQGNIIKGHGRNNACYLFLHFEADRTKHARRTLASVLRSVVTSAYEQREQTKRSNESKQQTTFGMFALSHSGYKRLAISDYGPAETNRSARNLFERGLRNAADSGYLSWDPELDWWQSNYNHAQYDIHALLLLASNEQEELKRLSSSVKKQLVPSARIVAEEFGRRQAYGDGTDTPNEHFGYRDGIAAPEDRRSLLAEEKWPKDVAKNFGSFVTYMKLEQNVLKFREAARQAAEKAKSKYGSEISPDEIEELIVGRRKSGLSLVDAPIGTASAVLKTAQHLTREQLDDFGYEGPNVDDVCPAHSHIRKMNLRRPSNQKEFQIARRGMSYGPERRDLEVGERQLAPSEGVGLLFMSFQSKADETVGLLTRASSGCKDALIGRSATATGGSTGGCDGDATGAQPWPVPGGTIRFKMGDFVTLKGGEYFFAPSMRFINRLDQLVLGDL